MKKRNERMEFARVARPIPLQEALPDAQGDIGAPFTVTLLLSLLTIAGSIGWHYILSPSNLTNAQGALIEKTTLLALLLASAVALALAVAATSHLLRGRWKRSWKSWVLTVVAALIALPGLCIGSLLVFGFVYSMLPLTASERRAIEVAEKFVERNGYTSAGHPKDLPVLQNDIMDPLAGSEANLLEMRRGTLQAEAFGVSSVRAGFLIFFEPIPPDTRGAYRTLEVDEAGHARILHQDMFPGWYKRTGR